MVESSGEPLARGVLQRGLGDTVLLPATGSPPGAASRPSQPRGLAGLCSRHFSTKQKLRVPGQRLPWEPSRLLTRCPALPPAPAPLCFPAGLSMVLPILLPAGTAGRGAGWWLSGDAVGSPGQDASLVKSSKMEAALPASPSYGMGMRCPTSRRDQTALSEAVQRGLNALVYMELISRFQTCFQAGLALFSCKRRPTPCCRQ